MSARINAQAARQLLAALDGATGEAAPVMGRGGPTPRYRGPLRPRHWLCRRCGRRLGQGDVCDACGADPIGRRAACVAHVLEGCRDAAPTRLPCGLCDAFRAARDARFPALNASGGPTPGELRSLALEIATELFPTERNLP